MSTVNWGDNAKQRIKTLLRGGYKLREVVADLIDNSIDYGGENCTVHVTFTLDNENSKPYLCIRDNGQGISPDDIDQAMTTGSRLTDYDPGLNLGMFGIGMKNSSLSQGKMVTVISKAENEDICVRRIDAEHILRTDIWEIFTTHSGSDVAITEFERLSNLPSGTTVLIEKMHKVENRIELETIDDDMLDIKDELDAYIGMVFEHYIKGTTLKSLIDNSHHGKKLTAYLNGTADENLIEPLDPFLSNLVGGTKFDTLQIDYKIEDIQFEQRTFDVDCNHFIIPHKELVPEEWKSRLDRVVEWNNGQGIYFYRNNRLITFGGWGGVLGIETHRVHSRVKLRIPSYPEAAEYFELDPHKREMELPRGPKSKLKKQFSKRWRWHPTDTTQCNHSSRCKDGRKRENRRAFIASQNQSTPASRQSALPVAGMQNQGNVSSANRTGQNNQNSPRNENQDTGQSNNVPQNNQNLPTTPPPTVEPQVNVVSKNTGPLMAILGGPIDQNWVIEINKNDPLYSKMIEKIRDME